MAACLSPAHADTASVDAESAIRARFPLGQATFEVQPPEPGSYLLTAPLPNFDPPLRLRAPQPEGEPSEGTVYVRATDFDTLVHESSKKDTWGLGVLRRGAVVAARLRSFIHGCPGGQWAELSDGGYVCSRDGVEVLHRVEPPKAQTIAPDLGVPLPYRYGKIIHEGAPRYARMPSAEERETIVAGGSVRGLDVERTTGVFFIALDRPYTRDGETFYRSVEGEYVHEDDLEVVVPPRMRGERLGLYELPLAFVHAKDAPVYRLEKSGPIEQGLAQKWSRLTVEDELDADEGRFVVGRDGWMLSVDDVRVARRIDRPSGIEPDTRWIHVDLAGQTLVAYEGEMPVYATLVSSGADGFETPEGLYRIRRKYVSRRMAGPDPDKGSYDIAEVPWAMYYHRGYALHGAYWHDEFGKVRSHGCTNIPPTDAQWLFHWASPRLPEGWHGVFERGTRVYFTR